jgi:hypothetical protein
MERTERLHRRAPLWRLLVLVATVVGMLGLGTDTAGATHTVEHRFEVTGGFPVTWDDGSSNGCADPAPPTEDYTLVHPRADLLGAFGDHPVVVFGSGTNWFYNDPALQKNSNCYYELFLRHLASWGFVVIAYNDGQVGSGQEMLQASDLAVLLDALNTPDNPFYDNLDTSSMAAVGHSQGAVGAINATRNGGGRFESVMTLAMPDRNDLNLYNFACNSPCEDVPIPPATVTNNLGPPIFFARGTGIHNPSPCNDDDWISDDTDDAEDGWYPDLGTPNPFLAGTVHVTPPTDTSVCSDPLRLYPHENLWDARGYMTAWLAYTLQNQAQARPAFVGANPEFFNAAGWEGRTGRGLT